jgi:hypothetical protein
MSMKKNDRGASAILITVAVGFLLMGMAALAIDVGAGFNERRLDQNGADFSVLGGALEQGLGGGIQDASDAMTALVDVNVRPGADWMAKCTEVPDGPDQLFFSAAELSLTPATECMSWNAAFSEVRVRVPSQDVDTSFGVFLGANSLSTNAAANATVEFQGEANSPPFVVPDGTGAGDQICLRTNSSGPTLPPMIDGNGPDVPYGPGTIADPCDDLVYDPDEEFFGTLDPWTYLDPVSGDLDCRQNASVLPYSIASGIDHLLSQFEPDFQVLVTDPYVAPVAEDDCNQGAQTATPLPNTMQLNTGLQAQDLRCGMVSSNGGGCTSTVPAPSGPNVPARMHLGSFVQGTYTFLGEDMDNKPLWDFLVPLASLSVPQSCKDVQTNAASNTPGNIGTVGWDYYDLRDGLLDCLTSWNPATHADLFDESILQTPRYAILPYLAENNLSTEPSGCPTSAAAKCVHFNAFVPVYLQAFYTIIQGGSAGDCDPGGSGQRWGIHQAGFPGDCGRNNDFMDRLSGIVLDCEMFPATMWQCPPGNPNDPGGTPIPVIELVR